MFRRLPVVLVMHKKIHEIEHFQQAAFVGFFGPIGVSAIFYLYVSLEFLNGVTVDGNPGGIVREDARHLQDVMRVVIWFLAICSIVVHGLSVPLGKLGYQLPRSMSRTMTSAFSTSTDSDEPDAPLSHIRHRIRHTPSVNDGHIRQRRNPNERPANDIFRIGGSAIQPKSNSGVATPDDDEPSRPIKFVTENNSPSQSPVVTPPEIQSKVYATLGSESRPIILGRNKPGSGGPLSGEAAVEQCGEGSGTSLSAEPKGSKLEDEKGQA